MPSREAKAQAKAANAPPQAKAAQQGGGGDAGGQTPAAAAGGQAPADQWQQQGQQWPPVALRRGVWQGWVWVFF